jgi:regulatory protein
MRNAPTVAQTSGQEELNKKILTRARNLAYRFLTYRSRSRAEIEQKLQDKGFDDEIIENVLLGLERLGYVNDRQFAGLWTASAVRLRGFGRRRIEQELKKKGIDRDIIRQTISDNCGDHTEVETAKKSVERKLTSMKNLDRETRRRRLAGFLERKGFSFGIIRSVLKDTEASL